MNNIFTALSHIKMVLDGYQIDRLVKSHLKLHLIQKTSADSQSVPVGLCNFPATEQKVQVILPQDVKPEFHHGDIITETLDSRDVSSSQSVNHGEMNNLEPIISEAIISETLDTSDVLPSQDIIHGEMNNLEIQPDEKTGDIQSMSIEGLKQEICDDAFNSFKDISSNIDISPDLQIFEEICNLEYKQEDKSDKKGSKCTQ